MTDHSAVDPSARLVAHDEIRMLASRYAVAVDVDSATVVVGGADALMVDHEQLSGVVWADVAARGNALAARGVIHGADVMPDSPYSPGGVRPGS